MNVRKGHEYYEKLDARTKAFVDNAMEALADRLNDSHQRFATPGDDTWEAVVGAVMIYLRVSNQHRLDELGGAYEWEDIETPPYCTICECNHMGSCTTPVTA